MIVNEVLVDAFGRIKEVVHHVVEGLSPDQLASRPGDHANSIAWLVWHLTRVQDDHVSDLAQTEQLWTAGGWVERFGLPLEARATGWGHTSEEVAAVRAPADLLVDYHDAVHARTVSFLQGLSEADYPRIVDTSWDPPVTMAVRLVSVIEDDLQHAGQAAYVRGLLDHERPA